MQPWVVIQNSSGVALGAGEITSAYNLETTRRLSRAGRFAFDCPLNDPMLTEIAPDSRPVLSEKRIALIYGVVLLEGGLTVIQELGGGVIDMISRTAPDTVHVEGDDLFRELTYRSVLGLQNFEYAEFTATQVKTEDGSVDPDNPTYADLPLAHDGNPVTFNTADLQTANYFLLIGYTSPFGYIYFDLGAQVNSIVGQANYGFSVGTGDGYDEIEPTTDGTIVAGVPLAQDGQVLFTVRPGGWASSVVDGDTAFWVRLDPDADFDPIDFAEIRVGVPVATTNDLSNIMGYAPAGWSLDIVDWYPSTTNGSFYHFTDENVLEALIKTSEITGEHFRLGQGREVEWMQNDTPDSGIRATQVTDPTATPAEVCYIENIEQELVSYELATRVYGRAAGMADKVIDFSDITPASTDPPNYTTGVESIVQTNGETEEFWYIESDNGVATYGRIEHFLYDKSITAADGYGGRDSSASDAIWTKSLVWLQRHDTPQYFYRLSVVGCQTELKVGETIRVEYKRVVTIDGVDVVTWEIDTDLIILETTNRVGSNGLYTSNLVVSTVADWWQNDSDAIADTKREVRDFHNANQGIAGLNIR